VLAERGIAGASLIDCWQI